MNSRIGPRGIPGTILHCDGCEHHQDRWNQRDGINQCLCAHPSADEPQRTGNGLHITPSWCPTEKERSE